MYLLYHKLFYSDDLCLQYLEPDIYEQLCFIVIIFAKHF